MLVLAADAPFWPKQAIACTAILGVLVLLVRYLYRGPRTRGTTRGLDALLVVWGCLLLFLMVVLVIQRQEVGWRPVLTGATFVVLGSVIHRQPEAVSGRFRFAWKRLSLLPRSGSQARKSWLRGWSSWVQ